MGIFHGSAEELAGAVSRFADITAARRGSIVKELSVAVGTVAHRNYPDMTIDDLEILADDAMYANKKQHHAAQ